MTDSTPAMTVREVALYLNVNEKTVYRLAQRNELPGFKVAGAWRFRPEDIRRWVEGQKSRAPATPSKPRMEDEDKQKRKQR